MEKVLTISIAAYNVEKYIRQALDSIVQSKYIEQIEVLVVDDGSPDNVVDIVNKEYHTRFPDSFFAIHKDNEGYGSTVNCSVENSSGKFFKLLDGDDWFNTEGLDRLIEFLCDNTSDWILSPMIRYVEGNKAEVLFHKWVEYSGHVLSPEMIEHDLFGGIWETTFRTELLKAYLQKLPHHCLYTDRVFMAQMIPVIKSVGFTDIPVYCYRVGRDGQSISPESRVKHYKEYLYTTQLIIDYYYKNEGFKLPRVLREKLLSYYKFDIFNLLLLPISNENRRKIIALDKDTKCNARDFYFFAGVESKKIRLLRATAYLTYWPIAKLLNNNW